MNKYFQQLLLCINGFFHQDYLQLLKNPVHCLSLGFGSGAAMKAPGTFGSLMALPLILILVQMPLWFYAVFLILSFALGVLLCETTAQVLQQKDPSAIVFDEIVGMLVCGLVFYAGAQPTAFALLLVFAVFRFFYNLKPFPISWADQRFEGGFGIMFDDVIAGVMSLIVLNVLFTQFSW